MQTTIAGQEVPRVFFSFHYELDRQRADLLRQRVRQRNEGLPGLVDGSLHEAYAESDTALLMRRIDRAILQCSLTVVLVGQETAGRYYVNFEIERRRSEHRA